MTDYDYATQYSRGKNRKVQQPKQKLIYDPILCSEYLNKKTQCGSKGCVRLSNQNVF